MNPTKLRGHRALRKGRCSLPNHVYFVTAVTYERVPWFRDFHNASLTCRVLSCPGTLLDGESLCYVLMPDHLHVLLQLRQAPLSKVVNSLKSKTAVQINRAIGRKGRFWAPNFYDHAVRKGEDLRGIARYIVANPLRAGLARTVGDYPFWNAVWL